ncbi:uncharacterized protein Z518_09709 [Rhinocladiella mackenziei CBS 650.93]|uniref:Uncharacterized protein n=1 Tax=Rhinocladiella mackenziei CBS 650.93 TaxID=1442369 RepID=A0A0D2I4D7_9EURO|nr:uncharacterized protein Z518_09709 [Rhinocladiella mackenziei CBS 650.93]KIX00644.1 hypothetical protein Z518_09709 [Rhinocladiella mackenziei CBS 650.93]
MRPPDSYEKLIDALSLASPIVRLSRDKPQIEVKMDFDYIYSDVIFDSQHLGEITTDDALEEHELVLQDLIEDDAFVEAVLGEGNEEGEMIAALLRVARAHERPWTEKLQRKRLARLRETQQNERTEPPPDI